MDASAYEQADPQQHQQQQQQREEAEARKHALLRSILTPEASARLSTVALVKPEQANMVSQQLLSAAQSGRLQEKVSEDRLKGMLNALDLQHTKAKITFQRKKPVGGDDSDEDYSDL